MDRDAHTQTHTTRTENKNRARKAVIKNSSGAAGSPRRLSVEKKIDTQKHTHTHTCRDAGMQSDTHACRRKDNQARMHADSNAWDSVYINADSCIHQCTHQCIHHSRLRVSLSGAHHRLTLVTPRTSCEVRPPAGQWVSAMHTAAYSNTYSCTQQCISQCIQLCEADGHRCPQTSTAQ